jgi:hypothetical protein
MQLLVLLLPAAAAAGGVRMRSAALSSAQHVRLGLHIWAAPPLAHRACLPLLLCMQVASPQPATAQAATSVGAPPCLVEGALPLFAPARARSRCCSLFSAAAQHHHALASRWQGENSECPRVPHLSVLSVECSLTCAALSFLRCASLCILVPAGALSPLRRHHAQASGPHSRLSGVQFETMPTPSPAINSACLTFTRDFSRGNPSSPSAAPL